MKTHWHLLRGVALGWNGAMLLLTLLRGAAVLPLPVVGVGSIGFGVSLAVVWRRRAVVTVVRRGWWS